MPWWNRVASMGLLLALAGLASGQTEKAPEGSGAAPRAQANLKREAKTRAPLAVTLEREAAVMTFVQRSHAELADLLTYLKASRPAEYERAVREIFRTTERLALTQERDPAQYELEVALWTAQSRVQLLTAKLKMGSSEEVQKELRSALGAQADARLALLMHERQKVADRLARIDSDISQLENNREAVIDRQLHVLIRAAEGGTAKSGTKKGAAKQAKKKTNDP